MRPVAGVSGYDIEMTNEREAGTVTGSSQSGNKVGATRITSDELDLDSLNVEVARQNFGDLSFVAVGGINTNQIGGQSDRFATASFVSIGRHALNLVAALPASPMVAPRPATGMISGMTSPTLTGEAVRHRFPGIAGGWARFDGPAGTLPVDTCTVAIADYMSSPAPANLGGAFLASQASDEVVTNARVATARLVGAEPEEIVFGPSTTNLMFAFTRALSQQWSAGDRIVCTQLDHDSNITPWVLAARDVGATVEMLPVDPVDGTLDVEPLSALCADGRTRWVALSGASNLTGFAPDIARAAAIAHEHGARILVDGVARVPHLPTNAAALNVDVLSTSPYKWYGPHAGVLAVRGGLLASIEPYRVRPADYVGPPRWETGTPQIELLAGITAAAEFMTESAIADVQAEETRLLALLQEGLHDLPGVVVHGPSVSTERAPTVIFTVTGMAPEEVAARLADERIAVWSGDNYACELIDALGLRAGGGAVRAGIVRYSSVDDVVRLLTAVANLSSV